MTIEELKEFVLSGYRAELVEDSVDKIIFKIHDKNVELIKSDFVEATQKLNILTQEETEVYDSNSYEILVRDASRIIFGRERDNCIEDSVNGLKYSYGKPSDSYLLYFISKLLQEESRNTARRVFDPHRIRRNPRIFGDEQQLELFNLPLFDVLRESLIRLETLRIESTTLLKKNQFEQFSYSYIFSLSYNTSRTIYPIRFFDEFFSSTHIARLRRASFDEIEPPKRVYINDLILFYQKGISSESVDHQYLSFFHILEHFFEKIYNEDLLNNVKNELTKPGFSYKKKRDIETLVAIIQKRLKYKNDEFQINEIEALELTLTKYIDDFNEIKEELNTISADLIDYFKTTEVPFSKGNRVNFEIDNKEEIFKNLSKRIYLTRNSIVHSKETEKEKYVPFRDDKDLIPEIHLMRILTEKIIISNSKEI
jgi:hypothetical protein